jgi:hypothetical protein
MFELISRLKCQYISIEDKQETIHTFSRILTIQFFGFYILLLGLKMEGLIEVINEIHDVLKKNKITAKEIQLPRFVVVGEQVKHFHKFLKFW